MERNIKRFIKCCIAVVFMVLAVLPLFPFNEAEAAGNRLQCACGDEVWINRAYEIKVTLKNRSKSEDITVTTDISSGFKVKKGKWNGDTCRLTVTPKKNTDVVLTVGAGSESVSVTLHMSKRKKLTAAQIYDKIESAMVTITTKDTYGNVYIGSGFFVGRNQVLTNYHVVNAAQELTITDYDGYVYTAKGILGCSEKKDLLLFSVKVPDGAENTALIPAEDIPAVGEPVYSCGSPYGLQGTFVNGIVSATGRELDGNEYFQVTVPTSTGAGGSAVVNSYGELVGITTLTVPAGQNMNFAIPVSVYNEAKSDPLWQSLSLNDLFRKNYGTEKESNDYQLSDSMQQLTNKVQAKEAAGTDFLSAYEGEKELTPTEIYNNSQSAMIRVAAYDIYGSGSQGSGFFLNEDTIVTNYHVLSNSHRGNETELCPELIYVADYQDNIYEVVEAKGNALSDVAIIKIKPKAEVTHGYLTPDYDYIPFVGENVYAFGNPLDYRMTFSSGQVSTSLRRINLIDFIQMTAPITNGSSGGALLNKYGRVIGITSMCATDGQNLNWAIMIKYIRLYL